MRRKIRFGVIIFALAFVTILTLVFKDQQEAIYGYINSLYYIVVILIAMWYRKLLIPTVMYLIVLHVSVGFFALGTIPIQVVYELMLQLLIAIVMWFILKKRDVILNEYIGLISEMQLGFAKHEIVVDDHGNVVDYRFLYVNKSFEKLTGFKEEDIINKTVLEVMPNTEKSWIAIYGDVAKTGKSIEYTDYSSALRKWFRVVAYSPKKNQFVTIFMDMTSEEELKQKLDYENQKFTKLVESSNDIIYELDMDMRYISVYGMLTKDESKDMQTIIGKTAEEIFSLGEAKIHIESNKKALNGEHCIYDWKTIDEKQKMRFYQTSLSPILDKDQKIIGAVGITRNISERVETEMELIHTKELMEYVIEHDRSAVAIHDKDLNYLYVSKDYLKQYRIEHKNVIGKHHYEVFTDIPQKWKDVHQRVLKGETISAEYDPFIRGDGTIDWTSWECRPWYEKDGQIGGMILYTEVINKRKKMEEDLFRIAYYDKLTQLPNRVKFEELIDNRIIKEPERKFAFVYFDMDDFRHINETQGHHIGDSLVQKIASGLTMLVQSKDVVARMVGDEFAILVSYIKDEQDAMRQIEGWFQNLTRTWHLNKQDIYISFSVGVSIYPNHGDSFQKLFQSADLAMFESKEKGKNQVSLYESHLLDKANRTLQTTNEMRKAINKNEFYLVYQPKINCLNESITGFETLIRWKHPKRGHVPPMEFIPLAERCGFITTIDDYVIQHAFAQKQSWNKQLEQTYTLSINLSQASLNQKDLVKKVVSWLETYQLQASEIEFEITETAAMHNFQLAKTILKELRHLGFVISLDDFGTGHSSLINLNELPIDIVKIDRSLLLKSLVEKKQLMMMRLIIQMVHGMNLKVVAEGIETIEQLNLLKSLKCDFGQGYYFYKPMSSEELMDILDK